MSTHFVQLPAAHKSIKHGHIRLGGMDPAGNRIGVNNYYLELNERPLFGVSGEFHFSRCDERYWEDELVKIRMGGINVVATYIFWNHHEEIQGHFDWEGRKNLRRFVELCGKQNLWTIIRIGPWCHGEVRNGGFPDWLYGRPFCLRSDDEEYLAYVRLLYEQIAAQVKGLLYKDGGPIIGTQLENEYMHSSAPWEMTTGVSDEWIASGRDGQKHILTLKRLAREAGIDTPLYTCTAWGGAAVPVPHVLPLWGGYAFQPWIFYGEVKDHPATPEYIFRDQHNDDIPKTYNFEPQYKPEDYPYACCEIGGGMQVYYRYRFRLPLESVEAMALVKAAGGCNFLGYYMYHGGTNPHGKRVPYLNEHATPKLSYDYQAPIGEFGQLREHYRRLRLLHYFFRDFQDWFCGTRTVLPQTAVTIDPRDVETPRYAVRALGNSGILFLNNYQDHVETKDHEGVSFTIQSGNDALRIPHSGGLTLGKNVCCMLPFNFDLDGILLKYAVAQLITRQETQEGSVHVFFVPEKMQGELYFDATRIKAADVTHGSVRKTEEDETLPALIVNTEPDRTCVIRITGTDDKVRIVYVLTRNDSLGLCKVRLRNTDYLFVTEAAVLSSDRSSDGLLRFEWASPDPMQLKTLPPLPDDISISGAILARKADDLPFACYKLELPSSKIPFSVKKVGARKALLTFEEASFQGFKQVILQIDYSGDIGNAYIDGQLVSDNFCNGVPWEIEITRHRPELLRKGMYIDVVPLKKGTRVVHETSMAGRHEVAGEETGEIKFIRAVGIREVTIR